MSGHSKWATTHRKKEAADAKRGAIFTKLANALTVAAREMGGDPETNFKLRLATERAKQANMPKDNIERAIKKGTGELEGVQIEEMIYEGFGPNGVALIIEALTDNKNRTVSEIKHVLAKHGGKLGSTNTVMWMFEKKGVLHINTQGKNKEELQLKIIDLGADDVKEEDDGLTIYTKMEDFKEVKDKLEKEGLDIDYAEIEYVPKETVKVDEETKTKIEKLFEDLDNLDDVNNFYTNAQI